MFTYALYSNNCIKFNYIRVQIMNSVSSNPKKFFTLPCIILFSIFILITCSEDDDDEMILSGSSSSQIEETENFVSRLVDSLCQWYSTCSPSEQLDSLSDCVNELLPEVKDDISEDGQICNDFIRFYLETREELEACLQNPTSSCTNDDVTSFCPAFKQLDIDNICVNQSQTSHNNQPTGNTENFIPDVRTMVVGGWSGRWICDNGAATGTMYWSLCPNGKLRGFTTVDTNTLSAESIASGSYSVNEDSNEVSFTLVETVVNPSIIRGDKSSTDLSALYSTEEDVLHMQNYCGFSMVRLEGGGYDEINNSDCESSVTSVGGGNNSCGTDCDCGRCWYCESGTCRYGGEGPYGCYRGCN
jgi:hypothetical protein